MRRILSLAVAGLVLAGCGGAGTSGPSGSDLTLLLGGPPAAEDAGIYLAVDRGFDEAEGVSVTIQPGGDPVKQLRQARVQAAVMDTDQARAAGAVCLMALRQTPRPGPFVCVARTTVTDDPGTAAALVKALQRGYGEASADPESAVQAIVTRAPGVDYTAALAELNAISPSFTAGAPFFGWLDRAATPPADRALFDFSVARPFSRD